MTKKNITGLLVIAGLLIAGAQVHAEEYGGVRSETKADMKVFTKPAGVSANAEVRANMEARQEEKRENMSERMEDKRDQMREKFEGRKDEMRLRAETFIEKHVEFMKKRMTATIERLSKIADRIDSRIDKMEAEGTDTDEAEGFVADARAHLRAAEALVAEISATVEVGMEAKELRGAFEDLRTLVKEIRDEITEARESLRKAVVSLAAEASVEIKSSTNAEAGVQ